MNNSKKQEQSGGFLTDLFKWNMSEEELKNQVENYDTLGFFRSSRKVATAFIILSTIISSIFVIVGWQSSMAWIDILFLSVLAVFIYKGKRWVIIIAMIYWTFDRILKLLSSSFMKNPSSVNVMIFIFWWAIIMKVFWQAYQVERERKKLREKSMNEKIKETLPKIENKEPNIFLPTTRGKRFWNLILDHIFFYIFGIILALLIGFLGLYPLIKNMNDWILGIIIIVTYYVVFESIWFKTPAKFITRTRVIMDNGENPTPKDIFIRSLVRFVPFEQFSFLDSDRPRGWHDRWSKTMVVDDSSIFRSKEESKKNNKPIINKSRYLRKWIPIIIGIVLVFIIISSQLSSNHTSYKNSITQGDITLSVVNIFCSSQDNRIQSGGSGIMFAEDGGILTNYHVVAKTDICFVTIPNTTSGAPDEIYLAKPLIIPIHSKQYDIAFLEITGAYVDKNGTSYGMYPNTFKIFKNGEDCINYTPKLGESIKVYGYPVTSGSYNLTITDGIISSFTDDGFILTSAKIDSGNSGGLAINEDGCFVGIPSAVKAGNYQNLGVVIPVNIIRKFINQLNI